MAARKKAESSVLMVMNLPDSLTDDHVRELLSPFGELKQFNLLKVTACLGEIRVMFGLVPKVVYRDGNIVIS